MSTTTTNPGVTQHALPIMEALDLLWRMASEQIEAEIDGPDRITVTLCPVLPDGQRTTAVLGLQNLLSIFVSEDLTPIGALVELLRQLEAQALSPVGNEVTRSVWGIATGGRPVLDPAHS